MRRRKLTEHRAEKVYFGQPKTWAEPPERFGTGGGPR